MSNRHVEIEFEIENARKQEVRNVTRFNETRGTVIDVRSTALAAAAKERARALQISFSEGLRQINSEDATAAAYRNLARTGAVDPKSIVFAEAAQKRAAADGISYGDALKLVYQESGGSTLPPKLKVVVAAIEGGTIVLNAGSDVGLQIGARFLVQRPGAEVTDPASGKVIRQMVTRIGEIQVTEVDPLSSLATGVPAANLQVGDLCELVGG